MSPNLSSAAVVSGALRVNEIAHSWTFGGVTQDPWAHFFHFNPYHAWYFFYFFISTISLSPIFLSNHLSRLQFKSEWTTVWILISPGSTLFSKQDIFRFFMVSLI